MTFEDLPKDWPSRPLDDPIVGPDVVDLCVSYKDRLGGGLSVLFCRADATLAQPVFIGDFELGDDLALAAERMIEIGTSLPGVGGLVMSVVREVGCPTDEDRRVHQRALEVCASYDMRLVAFNVVTASGITPLAVAPELSLADPNAAA
ncbi:hypothetical protein [Ornithinimicrobium sp. Y1694]|uniref:hypothetical protein n=1 Tax=Ornithinimicrobium sp. Y1694 TaxID=3418590 RepID=UPI003CEC0F24